MTEIKRFKWEDGPFKLITTPRFKADDPNNVDAATNLATLMALIHNAWIRALNGLYVAAKTVPPKDYANFVGYASRVYAAIKKHHDEEEDFVYASLPPPHTSPPFSLESKTHPSSFPLIEQQTSSKGLMQANLEQHSGNLLQSWCVGPPIRFRHQDPRDRGSDCGD